MLERLWEALLIIFFHGIGLTYKSFEIYIQIPICSFLQFTPLLEILTTN